LSYDDNEKRIVEIGLTVHEISTIEKVVVPMVEKSHCAVGMLSLIKDELESLRRTYTDECTDAGKQTNIIKTMNVQRNSTMSQTISETKIT
jgi:hypothetical protein